MEERLPQNIYRIGQPGHQKKIFIEEYVISYLQETVKKIKEPQIIVFFGDGYKSDGIKYYFLKGAAGHRVSDRLLKKTDAFYFQKIGKRYFPALKGIGWYYIDSKNKEILDILREMQEQNFHDINGYYLFFERNEGMEEYLFHYQQKRRYHAPVLGERKVGKRQLRKRDVWKKLSPVLAVQVLNMISLCILIICCIIAVTTLNQYDKMKQLEETVSYLEMSIEEQKNLPEE